MRTILEVPDDLMRSVKVRAAQSDQSLTATVVELLRVGLSQAESSAEGKRVEFPPVRNARVATDQDLSPEQVFGILNDGDADSLRH